MSKPPAPLSRSSIAAITPTSYMPPITPPPANANAYRGRCDRHRPITRSKNFMAPLHCNPGSNRPAILGFIRKLLISLRDISPPTQGTGTLYGKFFDTPADLIQVRRSGLHQAERI